MGMGVGGKIARLGMCQEGAAGNGLLCNLSRAIPFGLATTPELSPEGADVLRLPEACQLSVTP